MKRQFLIIILCCIFMIGCTNSNESTVINSVQAKEKIINNEAILIDVRTEDEYNEKHIEGAVLLALDSINEESAERVIKDKNTPVIVYCKSGVRSHEALLRLQSLGYTEVYDLGAMTNWK